LGRDSTIAALRAGAATRLDKLRALRGAAAVQGNRAAAVAANRRLTTAVITRESG